MKNKFVRILSLLVVLCLALGIFAGCGKTKEVATNDGELPFVKLKCYVVGDMSIGSDEVLANLNTMLKEKINAELEVIELSWSDYKSKYSLVLSSGEPIDLIYTSNWCYFYSEGRKGAFMPLEEDMLKKYAPNAYAEIPEDAWNYVKIDGKISMLPQHYRAMSIRAITYREDLRKKYNVPEINTLEDLEVFFDVIKEKEPTMFPFNANIGDMENLYYAYMWQEEGLRPVSLTDALCTSVDDENLTIKPVYDTASYKKWGEIAKKWYEKGYWSRDILSNKTTSENAFLSGTSAAMISQLTSTVYSQNKAITKNPDWELGQILLLHNGKGPINTYTSNGMAIPSTSKNVERALMCYDLLSTDKEFYDAHVYGIKDKTYKVTEEGYYAYPDGYEAGKGYAFNGLKIQMGMNNPKLNNDDSSMSTDIYKKYVADINAPSEFGIDTPGAYIPFDTANFANQLSTLSGVVKNVNNLIITGAGKDSVDVQLEKYKQDAKKAGVDVIIEDATKQKDEFLKNYKK